MLLSAVYLFLILLPIVIILLFFFYKKKLQHQQILAAIEKGLPVTDLLVAPPKKETGWVPNISAGIGLLFVAVAMTIMYFWAELDEKGPAFLLVIPVLFAGLGLTRLFRGFFQKSGSKNVRQVQQKDSLSSAPNA
jgi:hypothetical protein